jgi:hypothetical protein
MLRLALADRYTPRLQRGYKRILNAFVRQVAQDFEKGDVVITNREVDNLQRSILKMNTPLIMALTNNAYDWTNAEYDFKSARSARAKEEGIFSDLQYERPEYWPDVERYLEETSKIQAQTTRQELNRIIQSAEASDKATKQTIKKAIVGRGLARSNHRARMLSRTLSMWSYNEGAHQSYTDAGIQKEDWLATADDVTCEFCMAMDEEPPAMTSNEFFGGGELQGLEGGQMNIPFAIEHPPLHPNCRCVMVPIV